MRLIVRALLFTVLFFWSIAAASAQDSKVNVYYFHSTNRCVTCKTIEAETINVLNTNFKNDIEAGTVVAHYLNVDESANKAICEKLKVYGSSLLVTKGDKVVNLTNMAFSYARRDAAKFAQELTTEINKLKALK